MNRFFAEIKQVQNSENPNRKARVYVKSAGVDLTRADLREVSKAVECAIGSKVSFSAKAGCGCGCSPGFIAKNKALLGRDIWVNVKRRWAK